MKENIEDKLREFFAEHKKMTEAYEKLEKYKDVEIDDHYFEISRRFSTSKAIMESLHDEIHHIIFEHIAYEEYIALIKLARVLYEEAPDELLAMNLGGIITSVVIGLERRFYEDPDLEVQDLRYWAYGLNHTPELHCKPRE